MSNLPSSTSNIVLGIDPGLAHTGWGVVAAGARGARAVAYGCITTMTAEPLSARLSAIYEGITEVIETYRPTAFALEGVFFGVNAKSALALGQARGVAILAGARRGLELGEYPPATIKQVIVGEGRADKAQIAYMVRTLLALDHDPKPDHCSDALAAALTHVTMSGRIAQLERAAL